MHAFLPRGIVGAARRCGRQLLSAADIQIDRTTRKEQVGDLIRRLHPLRTNFPLVRLGPESDGGYLVPDDLVDLAACFSPGVDQVSGFEMDCAARGMQVFLADRSVDGPAAEHPSFVFQKKYIGMTNNEDFMTLDSWIDSAIPNRSSDLLLQIDIEGFEYETFASASDAAMKRFRIIVAEFHHLDQLWNRHFFGLASRVFDKILQTHICVHIHPNNVAPAFKSKDLEIPPLMEFTFHRRDRVQLLSRRTDFPHPLDRDNTLQSPLPLPKCWFTEME